MKLRIANYEFPLFLISLTGNIATGKSTVCDILEQLGARVIDADLVAHAVLLRGTRAWRGVVDAFGDGILRDDGSVDRRKLGAVVFGDPAKLKTLEAVTHPAIGVELGLLIRDALTLPGANERVVVIEAVKLYEAGLHQYGDALWVVTAPYVELKRRLMQERGMSEAEADARLRAQPPLDEKIKDAQVVIDNGGTIEETRVQVMRAFVQIDPASGADKTPLLMHWLGIPAPNGYGTRGFTGVMRLTSPPSTPAPDAAAFSTAAALPATPPLTVRRVRPGDVDLLAQLLTEIEGRETPFTRAEVLERFGRLGYWLVQAEGQNVALAAWQAENLVAVVRELWVRSASNAAGALPLLLQAIEQEANVLTCEVVIIAVPPRANALGTLAAETCGYQPAGIDSLHRQWRSVIVPTMQGDETLYTKQLRELVTKPI